MYSMLLGYNVGLNSSELNTKVYEDGSAIFKMFFFFSKVEMG